MNIICIGGLVSLGGLHLGVKTSVVPVWCMDKVIYYFCYKIDKTINYISK